MADKTKAMGGDWNPGWCLSPKKGFERVMVKLSGTNRCTSQQKLDRTSAKTKN